MAKPQTAPKVIRDPKNGTALVAPAGGRVEAHFQCVNPGNPNVAIFALQVMGLPEAGWAKCEPRGVAPEGEETLILTLQPPYDAAEGDYDLSVVMLMDNAPLGPATTLILQVEGFVTPPETEVRSAGTPPPVVQTPPEQTLPEQKQVQQVEGRQQQEDERRQREQEEQSRQQEERNRAQQERKQREEERARQQAATPHRDDPPLVTIPDNDTSRPTDGAAEPIDDTPPPNSIEDPKDGATLTLRPGETLLVRFPVSNDMPRNTNYGIDHDHTPLVEEWIELTPEEINMPRNGKGELGLRITIPLSAKPGDYSFTVMLGPVGGAQTTRGLILSVLPTPAVRLTAGAAVVKVGPFSRPVDFELKVTGDGNADTAFRISVKAPQSGDPAAGPAAPSDLYETQQWRYLFNKELDNVGVEARSSHPKQAAIQLRLARKGIWWLGFQESHRFRAAAVPVTEPTNCGKTANSVELTAVRWRLLPFPLFLLIPLFLLFFLIASGGASDLRVTNPDTIHDDLNNVDWIVQPAGANKKVMLEWEASPWDVLRLKGRVGRAKPNISVLALGSGEYTNSVTVPGSDYEEHTYEISRAWGGSTHSVTARLVHTFDERKLRLTATSSAGTVTLHPDPKTGVVELHVPSKGAITLVLTNVSHDLEVWYHLVKGLSASSPFRFEYFLNQGTVQIKSTTLIPIKMNSDAPPTGEAGARTDEILYVTNSAQLPVLRVKLRSDTQGEGVPQTP